MKLASRFYTSIPAVTSHSFSRRANSRIALCSSSEALVPFLAASASSTSEYGRRTRIWRLERCRSADLDLILLSVTIIFLELFSELVLTSGFHRYTILVGMNNVKRTKGDTTMTYKQFTKVVDDKRLSLAQLRCDVPPIPAVLALIDDAGNRYEKFVLRLQQEMTPVVRARSAWQPGDAILS